MAEATTDSAETARARLEAIAAGDVDAFADWLAEAEPIVRRSLRTFAARVDVEAVMQETLLRAWQLAPRVLKDGRQDGLLRLSLRVAHNLAIDEARRAAKAELTPEPLDDAPTDPGDAPAAPDPFLRARIERCAGELPKKPRAALDARLARSGVERPADIAATLGMRTNTYLQNLARARRLLEACLARLGVVLEGRTP
jgi:RNA polymerase sigma-70 factor (ECF subfamily)